MCAVPGSIEPVMASTVSALGSVVYSEPLAEVAQAVSSTGLEIFRTCRFLPLEREKISYWPAWASLSSPPSAHDRGGPGRRGCRAGTAAILGEAGARGSRLVAGLAPG